MKEDEMYMRRAIELAERGRGWTNPNPVVGAVVVKEGAIIGEGYHEKYGELHAERNALADCRKRGNNAQGATIYVTLEPCCHYGKTPPCTQAIIEAGIKRVVIGAVDTNPLVGGMGIAQLREQKIIVQEGVLREECEQQNRIFFHWMQQKTPYVVMKYAMTLDGKIAAAGGRSKWITGEAARMRVHRMRHELMGIMVGVGTVLCDNPGLDCRIPGTKNPIRIICDTTLRTPLEAKVVTTACKQRTILVTCCSSREKIVLYEERGCEVLIVKEEGGHVSLCELMKRLGELGIDSILLEGGAKLNWSAIESGIVNEVHAYIAPKLLGGETAKSPITGAGILDPNLGIVLKNKKIEAVGEDILVWGQIDGNTNREQS